MMKFSVLMSIYIREKPKNLRECLDSLLNQTVLPNEIVIVKDGPLTEELENVLNEYIKQIKNCIKLFLYKQIEAWDLRWRRAFFIVQMN